MTPPPTAPILSAELVLRAATPPAGSVTLRNGSADEVRLWAAGNSWGDGALRFEVVAGEGAPVAISRRLGFYTRDVPASFVLEPGARHEITFDLGDGTWDLDAARALLERNDARLRAVYDSGDSPEAQAQGIHHARLHTRFVPLHA